MKPTVSAIVAVARCARFFTRITIEKLFLIEGLTPIRTFAISDWGSDADLLGCQIDMRTRYPEIGHVLMYSKSLSCSKEQQWIMRSTIIPSHKAGVLK